MITVAAHRVVQQQARRPVGSSGDGEHGLRRCRPAPRFTTIMVSAGSATKAAAAPPHASSRPRRTALGQPASTRGHLGSEVRRRRRDVAPPPHRSLPLHHLVPHRPRSSMVKTEGGCPGRPGGEQGLVIAVCGCGVVVSGDSARAPRRRCLRWCFRRPGFLDGAAVVASVGGAISAPASSISPQTATGWRSRPTTTARNTAATAASGPQENRRRGMTSAGGRRRRGRRRRRFEGGAPSMEAAGLQVGEGVSPGRRPGRPGRRRRCAGPPGRLAQRAGVHLGRGEARLGIGQLFRRQRHDAIGVVVVHGHASVGCRFGWPQVPELLGEQPPPAEQSRFHRAHRYLEGAGRGVQRQSLEVDEDDGGAELRPAGWPAPAARRVGARPTRSPPPPGGRAGRGARGAGRPASAAARRRWS